MLRAMNINEFADKIENSIKATLKQGKYLTGDLGGRGSTSDYTNAVIDNL